MLPVSIVIPARDEQDNIEPLAREIVSALESETVFEILFVDDGSRDNTLAIIQKIAREFPCIRAIRHQYSAGQSTALTSGVQAAKGNLIVTLDADGQNDPADIPAMLKKAAQFSAQQHFCIAGYRIHRRDTPWKRVQSRLANQFRSRLLRDATPDTGCGLKVFPRHTFLQLPYFDHMHRFLPALIIRLGGNVDIHPVNHRPRMAGQSKYNMLNRAWAGLIDTLGVMWLMRRTRHPQLIEPSLNETH